MRKVFTLIELLIVAMVMILLLYVPYGSLIFVLMGAGYGVYGYVRFCQMYPSIWQMRRQARRMHGKEDEDGDPPGAI